MKKKTFSKLMSLVLSLCMLMSLVVVPAVAATEIADMDGHWAKAHAERWVNAEIMELDEKGNFNPDHKVTRGEFAVILSKLMGYTKKADASTFTDLPTDKEVADAILMLSAAGVMEGVGDQKADPNGILNREHVAVEMFRALKLEAVTGATLDFVDADQVSDWARTQIATMASKKMIEGRGNKDLDPKADIINSELAALLDKMIADYVTENGYTVDLTKEGTSNPNGAVIIKANNVKIANAAESTAVVVTEGAPKNATVSVTGPASSITVAAEGAKVTVAKDAKVDSLTVEAPKASVTVNGAVGTMAVAAEEAKVTVAKGAEVTTVAVSAPKAALEVSGTVTDVAVAAGADNAAVTAKSGAKVGSITTSAENVKINGAKNAITSITTESGSADIKAKGAKVENTGATTKVDGKNLEKDKTQTSNQTGSGTSSSSGSTGGGSTTTYVTVKFDLNGASGTAPADQRIASGNKATKPADPTRDEYAFDGWYTDKDCTKAYDFDAPVTADTTLYAKWTAGTRAISLSVTDPYTFPAAKVGDPAPEALAVTITNAGTTATGLLLVELSGDNTGSFTLDKTNIGTIANKGTATFTVAPKSGLSVGKYTATVTVKASGESSLEPQTFDVSFTVNTAAEDSTTYRIIFDATLGTIQLNSEGTSDKTCWGGENVNQESKSWLRLTWTTQSSDPLTLKTLHITEGTFSFTPPENYEIDGGWWVKGDGGKYTQVTDDTDLKDYVQAGSDNQIVLTRAWKPVGSASGGTGTCYGGENDKNGTYGGGTSAFPSEKPNTKAGNP